MRILEAACVNAVAYPMILDQALLWRVDRVGGSRIAVAWLADRPGIQQVGVVRLDLRSPVGSINFTPLRATRNPPCT